MNQELKEQAHKEFDEKYIKKAEQFYKTAVSDQVAPYRHQLETLLDIKQDIDSLIDKTVQTTEERIVDLIERQYGDVVTTNKDVAIPHNCLEYETALDDIITLITNKGDINKDTL